MAVSYGPQLARWLTFIEEFDYEVVHRKGRSHANADALSRRRPEKPNEDTEPKRGSDTDSESSDTEKPETEQVVMNVRPVEAVHTENRDGTRVFGEGEPRRKAADSF